MNKCTECGEETKRGGKICPKCRSNLYYEHCELRCVMLNFLKHHGSAMAKEIYELMKAEEGEPWVRAALGEKIVNMINKSD